MSKNNGNTKAKTWLITGASSGLGYALAEYALQQGDRVALGARSQAAMTALAARYPDRALALALDVTNAEQSATTARSSR
jgi:NADP-dependent 3-hydroxy acid dehydrogenase YdfG